MFRFIFALIFFLHSTALAMPPTLSMDEVTNGMTGTAYTVVDPDGAIRNFNVKIVGAINNGKGNQNYIMAEASGDLIHRTGGVLQGMSGSPIYINGRLIGALAATFQNTNPYTFLITPIDKMLDIWRQPDTYGTNPYQKVEPVETSAEDSTVEIDAVEIADTEEKAAVIYSGFDSAGLDFLKTSLSDLGFRDFEIASGDGVPSFDYNAELFPGSPVGVAVVCGDFTVGATGTVTAVEDKKILGFGHPFLHAGNVNFFMTSASTIGAVTSDTGGMRISQIGSIIGRINQDRESGVGGVIGQFPAVVPISVTVNDEVYNSLIAYNENLVAKLGASIAYSALTKTIDNLGEGTIKVSFDIKTNAVDGGSLSRENMYYGAADVGQLAVSELLQALTLVTSNTTSESDILGIDVKMNYDSLRRTATLVKAEPDKKLVKPGEEVTLKVTLQPYRSSEVVIDVPYTVPITAKEGAFSVDIYGGGLVPVAQVQAQPQGVVTPSTKPPTQLYGEKIQQLLSSNKNNELIIKPSAVARSPKELKAELNRMKKLAAQLQRLGITPSASSPSKFATDYVIDNVIQCKINVGKL